MTRSIRPQAGPQTAFLATSADIAWYGGGAGGGKSFGILLDPLRYVANPGFVATFFRRTYPQIENPGGLWDASMSLYPAAGAIAKHSALRWNFPGGAYAVMRHLKQESNVLDWQGTELPHLAFDELTHFSEFMYWYMTSRLRSTCGVAPYLRATMNPIPDDDETGGWVHRFIEWWIGEDGYPIPERSGVIRHFERHDGEVIWCDEPTEDSKSFTFISASVYDNPALLRKDPNYLKNLKALPQVERDRLLGGNWNAKAVRGKVFKTEWLHAVSERLDSVSKVRFWDLAATEVQQRGDDPDWTVGALLAIAPTGRVCVEHVERQRLSPGGVEQLLTETARRDSPQVPIRYFRDPGQAGVYQDKGLRNLLRGYDAAGIIDQMGKKLRANPLSAACERGEVVFLAGPWNQAVFNQMISFPDGKHDDDVDAISGGFNYLTGAYGKGFSQGSYRNG